MLPSAQVATLLIGTLIPSLGLIVLAGRRMAIRRAAGSTARLHVRLVFFFSMVAALPTLLVAGFAAFLFQSGVDFWFSANSRGLMQAANEMAREYYVENQVEVTNETVTMAGDLRFYFESGQRTELTDPAFVEFVSFQMDGRDINEAAILQRVDDGSLRTVATYDITEASKPGVFGTASVRRLQDGERAVMEATDSRIEAVATVDGTPACSSTLSAIWKNAGSNPGNARRRSAKVLLSCKPVPAPCSCGSTSRCTLPRSPWSGWRCGLRCALRTGRSNR